MGALTTPGNTADGLAAMIHEIAVREVAAVLRIAMEASHATSGATAPVGTTWSIKATRTGDGFDMTVTKVKNA